MGWRAGEGVKEEEEEEKGVEEEEGVPLSTHTYIYTHRIPQTRVSYPGAEQP